MSFLSLCEIERILYSILTNRARGKAGKFPLFTHSRHSALPHLDPDREEPVERVCRRVPRFARLQPRPAVDGVPPPRLLRRAQLRRPFDNRRTINNRYRRGEHRVCVGRRKMSFARRHTKFRHPLTPSFAFRLIKCIWIISLYYPFNYPSIACLGILGFFRL